MMCRQICSLRTKFGILLLWLLWAHVPLMGMVAMLRDQPILPIMGGSAVLVACYHLSWRLYGTAPVTRYISAIVLVGLPALLVFLFHGHAWQMDMHMYFFATLALLIGWFDRRPIIVAALAIALHHLLLLFLLEWAVFQRGASLSRVGLHAVIVMFQAGVLVWISDLLASAFQEIEHMQDASVATNQALDQRRQEAEEANSAKSIFLANMSHEIRTPLNAVLGFCQLLQRTSLETRQQDYVDKISNSGSALLRLINDILDYSKNEAGKLLLEEKAFDPRKTVELQADYLLPLAQAKGITLRVDVSDGPVGIIGDELRLAQVVLNLLGNAVKFTEEGGVVLTLREVVGENGQPLVQLRISDTGIGIPEDRQDKLFTSFTQADTTTTRRFGGTGLGLAISRQIVQQMGGDISVESKEWHGTTFTVTLPMKADVLPDWAEALERLRNIRILAVDDNHTQREILSKILQEEKVFIETVSSGQEALKVIRTADAEGKSFDLVLLDWKMPGVDGIEIGRMIKADTELARPPKLVLMTAFATEALFRSIDPALFAACFSKPLEAKSLVSHLTGVLQKAAILPKAAPQLSANGTGQRLLLVEDNPINREIALTLLGDVGFDVDVAHDGREACEKVAANGLDYAAVLMDVQMPVMDGIAATREIRGVFSAAELPVIAMTAHAYAEERRRCLDAGMVDHIAKPLDHKQLIDVLLRHMIRRSASIGPPRSVDIADALDRLIGRKELLHKLLLNFAEQYHDVAQSLQALLAQGNTEEAHRICHNLKAVCGSLGLPFVAGAAEALETAIRQGAPRDVQGLIATLSYEVRSALVAIAQTPLEMPIDVLKDRLAQLLRQKSPIARLVMGQLACTLSMNEDDLRAHPVQKALDAADFETALFELSRLDVTVCKSVR